MNNGADSARNEMANFSSLPWSSDDIIVAIMQELSIGDASANSLRDEMLYLQIIRQMDIERMSYKQRIAYLDQERRMTGSEWEHISCRELAGMLRRTRSLETLESLRQNETAKRNSKMKMKQQNKLIQHNRPIPHHQSTHNDNANPDN